MTAKPSPVSLTPRRQPRSPARYLYSCGPSPGRGAGAWRGYLGGDPPPTPQERKSGPSTRSHPRPSASRTLSPLPSSLPPPVLPALPLLLPSLLLSFPSPLPALFFCCCCFSLFLLSLLPCLPILSFVSPAHRSHSTLFPPLRFLSLTIPFLSVCLSFLPSFSAFLSLSPSASPLFLTLNSSLVRARGSCLSLSF